MKQQLLKKVIPNNDEVEKQIMKLPYTGEKNHSIRKSLKIHLKKTLPANIEADIIYTWTKLSS